ncbi:Coiled-coil domain-containing protein 144A [Camelus dromedarius]|uniref:Coiled-coil domain-containing protein 144A n=1 Tax=Camelus dromedarius TaxID=9838 RepID=A0A5N4C096_CAMDR|nr:Coiled-coil domain-containing protein 144A [Camelus dromedarius]
MPREPEMNKEHDRKDVPVSSKHSCVEKHEDMWVKQGKFDWKNNSEFITKKSNQKINKIHEKSKINFHRKVVPLHDNSELHGDLKELPSNVTDNTFDFEEKDAPGASVSIGFQAVSEHKEPSLENVFPSYSKSESRKYGCQSSSKLYLNENKLDENDKPDIEHVFNKTEESFRNDREKLLKIEDPVHSFRSIELKESDSALLRGKIKEMENKVNWLQAELLKTREAKSQLKLQNVEWERQLCSMRFTLEQETKKKRNAYILYEKTKDDLKRKEKQYNEQVYLKQQLEITARALECKVKSIWNKANQSKQGKVNKYIGKQAFLEERVCELESENMLLRQQLEAAQNEAKSKNTILNIPEPFLDHMGKLEAMSRRVLMLEEGNKELIDESRCLKDRLYQYVMDRAEMENADLPAKVESTSSVLLHLSAETQLFLKELFMKELQKKSDTLEEEKKQLEEEVVHLRRHLEMNAMERSPVEQYKRETEERARRDVVEKLKELSQVMRYKQESEEQARQDIAEKLEEISQVLQVKH